MSFGLSGSEDSSQMLGSDVAVAYIDGYRGFATDYNITALSPVKKLLIYQKYDLYTYFSFSVLKCWDCIKAFAEMKY